MSNNRIIFISTMEKYGAMGEKTGWTVLHIPSAIAAKIAPGVKKSFRVKGKIDQVEINQQALIPIGEGNFIIPIKADLRKKLLKKAGDKVEVSVEIDSSQQKIMPEFLACLQDEPAAEAYFNSMPPGHRNYYSNWIASAKTDATKTKRIALAVNTLAKKMNFSEMIRSTKKED